MKWCESLGLGQASLTVKRLNQQKTELKETELETVKLYVTV